MRPAMLDGACLYDLGYFPMALDATQGEVRGMVVWVRPSSYAAALSLLDQLEGVTLPTAGQSGVPSHTPYCAIDRRFIARGLGLFRPRSCGCQLKTHRHGLEAA